MESKMNWKSIIATALITGVVTVATGVFLFWWQTEKSELTYNSIQSIPFDDASNKLFIQQIEIKNSGDKSAEDVVLVISFTDEIIQKSKITIDSAISHQKTINDKSIQLKIDSLNPNEGAIVSVLYQSPKSTGASVSLRAKGITGKLIGSNQKNNKGPIGIALAAAYAGVLAFLLSTKRGRTMLPIISRSLILGRSLGSNNQKDEIASALSLYGYPEKAKEYLCSGADRQYWVEADLLSAEAILGDEKLKKNTIEILLTISKIPSIAERSKAIAYYNIARIFNNLGAHDEKTEEYLELSKKLDKSEIEDRLSRDPVFLSKPESNKTNSADTKNRAAD
jgi:hypothetical protein